MDSRLPGYEFGWVDGQVVMQMLNISKSTLKNWRKYDLIVHSQMSGNGKLYYKLSDIQGRLDKNAKGGR